MKALSILFLLPVAVVFSQPNPDFSANPLVVCVGQPVSFTDLSTSANPIVSWTWNFGDGNGSNQQNPTHTYSVAGTKNITLTVFDGVTAVPIVKSAYILVHPLPNPQFTISATGCTVPTSPVISNVQPTSGHTYSWNFGNGQTSQSLNPTGIVYSAEGTYTVQLTVTNSTTGCSNSTQQTINISDFDTDFDVSDQTVCVGESVQFSDQSGNANQWNWNFGDGGLAQSQNPQHSYSNPGTYTVTLNSQNTVSGCSGSHTMTITVTPPPVVQFTADPDLGCNPLTVNFTNTTGLSGTYTWDFGNGQTFVGENPPPIDYTALGKYHVTLSIVDGNGCSASAFLQDSITVDPLIAEFVSSVQEGCEVLDVQFTDISQTPNPSDDPITEWVWDFGNGNTFNGQNPPVQSYPEGEYDVTLTVSTDNGCEETISISEYIRVGIHSVPDFTVNQTIDCAKSDFSFTNQTTFPTPVDESDVEYFWSFGDGGSSMAEDPTYNYPVDTGFFDVQLIVDYRGCQDTIIKPDFIYIHAPISLFSLSQSLFCNPELPVNVTTQDNAILGQQPEDVQMIWSWGDGSPNDTLEDADLYDGDQGQFSHTYSVFGNYTVQQVVHNFVTGCSDSTQVQITMANLDADFVMTQDSLCVGGSVGLTNASTSTYPIVDYAYNFGDGSTQLGQPNANHGYNQVGTYSITFFVEDQIGCVHSQSQDIVVLARPIADIDASALTGCAPFTVTYSAQNSTPGFPNGVNPAVFNWTFPDNSTQTTTNSTTPTSFLLTTEGNFTTSLVVTDAFGCVSNPVSVSTLITKPVASFNAPDVVCDLQQFIVNSTSTDASTWEWTVDGVVSGNGSENPAFQFDDEGSPSVLSEDHTLLLVVADTNGCVDSVQQVITVSMPHANPDYVFDGANVNAQGDFVCPPVFADLTDNSSSIGDVNTWSWNFGDGNTSVLQNPDNTYVFAGVYTATFAITDEYGCVDDTVLFEYLEIGGPTGEVSWELLGDICDPYYHFYPENLQNVTNIVWQLGDGTELESLTDFTHDYNVQGSYFPIAFLEDDNGCSVPYEMDELVVPYSQLNAFFEVDELIGNLVGDAVGFDDQSTGGIQGIDTWYWDFQEGTQVLNNGGDTEYAWGSPGNYIVTLIVEDHAGCTDTFSIQILISVDLEVPNVFTPNGDGINDFFQLPNDALDVYDVVIVNRWGNTIYEGNGQKGPNLWDGRTANGTMCTEGVYFYRVSGTNKYDGKHMDKHGFVTLEL